MSSKINSQKLWTLLTWMIITTLLLSGCGNTQTPSKKVYQVGVIFSRTGFDEIANGFKTKMAELGYVEGENVVYDIQTVDGDKLTAQQISEKFVAAKVDLILASGTGGAVAAKAATEG
ncbi:MAG TPA: ABC transporter substrate binding protein, partial [Anaerolineales bacterium]|nr:ABC transporter substrate binding protein [Anaerolineales bacterium]